MHQLDGTDLIISTGDGKALNPDGLTSSFRRFVKRAGLPKCGPHTTRHTYASLALAAGENPLAVSQAVGHYDPGYTLREYGHTLPAAQAAAAKAMDKTLSREPEVTTAATVTSSPTAG
jgi:integrase